MARIQLRLALVAALLLAERGRCWGAASAASHLTGTLRRAFHVRGTRVRALSLGPVQPLRRRRRRQWRRVRTPRTIHCHPLGLLRSTAGA